ncbi:Purine nucleoside phosphorylase [Armadillidium vulgare]|nr:Purine nucleoside phosphorylase [Armadillidium vulgare]
MPDDSFLEYCQECQFCACRAAFTTMKANRYPNVFMCSRNETHGNRKPIVSNAAGGLNPNYKVGDIYDTEDHINTFNFGGNSPLRGINDTRFGPLYPSMTNAYDKHLRQCAKKCATEAGFTEFVHEGIYTMMAGPMFETPAELKALRILGTDAVGMSTTPEVVAARHCGIRVFSFSLITNVCVTDEDSEEETVADVC